jgi:hypothetical protein
MPPPTLISTSLGLAISAGLFLFGASSEANVSTDLAEYLNCLLIAGGSIDPEGEQKPPDQPLHNQPQKREQPSRPPKQRSEQGGRD